MGVDVPNQPEAIDLTSQLAVTTFFSSHVPRKKGTLLRKIAIFDIGGASRATQIFPTRDLSREFRLSLDDP